VRAIPPPGTLVDIGGFRLHLHCTGNGSPTIVLDAALGASSLSWSLVQPELARLSRVCSYDRGGFGWSDPGPMPRTADRIAEELHTLLERARVPPPYVLVGHSFGGLVALIFARRFRSVISGLVLVDPAHAEDWVTPAPKEQVQIDRGVRLCRYGAVTARIGLARVVSTLVGFGQIRTARLLVKVASRRGLSRQDEAAANAGAVLVEAAFLRGPRQSDRVGVRQCGEGAGSDCGRVRRPAPRHHLVHRSRCVPAAAAGRNGYLVHTRPSHHGVSERPLDSTRSAAGRHRRRQRGCHRRTVVTGRGAR
jgi:pimeloyl-ACP methyl ester carboxylesterase